MQWTSGPCTGSNTNPCTFTIGANTSANAEIALNNYTVSTGTTGTGTGIVSGAGSYSYNSSVTVTASPTGGSTFVSWVGGQCNGQTGTSCTFTMPAGNTIETAQFDLPVSCASGKTFIASASTGTTATQAEWDGSSWAISSIANWGSGCNLPTYNYGAADITVTFLLADNSCQYYTISAGGGVIWASGDPAFSQCPIELYTP
jgi:hypothetical protein